MKTSDWLRSEPWYEQEVFIIGGGSSLKDFDFKLLEKLNTVGCNDAYKLGSTVCKICVFGDLNWYRHHKDKLTEYDGVIVTNVEAISGEYPSWVYQFDRLSNGLSKTALGWNSCTGFAAINLALILGAKTVYLLGFDMEVRNGKTNYHDEIIHPRAVLPSSYQMFLSRWKNVVKDLHKFPNRRIVNINDNNRLDGIDSISVEDYWKGKV